VTTGHKIWGAQIYISREDEEKKGEGLRRRKMSLKRLVMSSISRRARVTEPGRATVSST
jgi:hypothetical protein